MTIDDAIQLLKNFAAKHGGDVQLYFDCPKCGAAWRPSMLEAEAKPAIVLKGKNHD